MKKLGIFAAICVISLLVGGSPARARIVYERDSLYSHIVVEDIGGTRTLYFNTWPQTEMLLRDPYRGALQYTEMYHAVLAFNPQCKRVLVIGLGGGSTQKAFLSRYSDITVQTVEIDKTVAQVAREYFYVPESSRHTITIEDGRRFLARSSQTYDAILVDAYLADYYGAYAPFHLATQEFFRLAKSRLNERGVLAYNVIWSSLSWNDASLRTMHKTVSSVFGSVYMLPARRSRNVVLVCVPGNAPSSATLKNNARVVDKKYGRLPTTISSLVSQLSTRSLDTRRVPVLTDDYAPVETLNLLFR